MRAFAYLRVSDVRQELSPEAQRAQLEAYCIVKGYELVHLFEEPAVSAGTRLRARQEGSKLLARLGDVDAVVFAKLDRAFRDTIDCLVTAADLAAAGKSLHFLDLGIDTSTAAGEMCMTFLAGAARFERRRIGDRIREALAEVKKQGRKVGPAGFGFANKARVGANGRKVDAGLQEPVAVEASVVNDIVYMHRRGMSLRQIARDLHLRGIPTRRGGQWSGEHVRKILARSTT